AWLDPAAVAAAATYGGGPAAPSLGRAVAELRAEWGRAAGRLRARARRWRRGARALERAGRAVRAGGAGGDRSGTLAQAGGAGGRG
ncbi:MAG TPA: hypothetical protein VF665_04345, partial [Longimicrobium sp.]